MRDPERVPGVDFYDIFLLFSPRACNVIVHVALFGKSLQDKHASRDTLSP